jgi:Mn-dependent DtxR family transcriptional regulator
VPGKVSQSAEDYLERIHELIETKGSAHVADIAQFFKENPKALAKFQSTRNNGSLD